MAVESLKAVVKLQASVEEGRLNCPRREPVIRSTRAALSSGFQNFVETQFFSLKQFEWSHQDLVIFVTKR